MNTDNFCHWLDGFFTLSKRQTLNKQDVNLIKEHLNLTLRPKTLQSIGGDSVLKTDGVGIVVPDSPTYIQGANEKGVFICNASANVDNMICKGVGPVSVKKPSKVAERILKQAITLRDSMNKSRDIKIEPTTYC